MKDRIRELLHSKPFYPFVIHMADGTEYRVEDPAFVMASPNHRTDIILEESRKKIHYPTPSLIRRVDQMTESAS